MLDSNDHRDIGQRLSLFHFQEEAPGMVFWHPDGLVLYRLLERAAREHCAREGYREIRTPQVLRRPVWEASGHWSFFRENMFRIDDQSVEAALKPVSCPGHIHVARRRLQSYRDLPLRLAELGTVHRDEPSGTLHGLLRVRQFTQDDGHVFCTEAQVEDEVVRFVSGVAPFYAAFGFAAPELALSLRPDEREGDDAAWDAAEGVLRAALVRLGLPFAEQPGAGAFYGPKIELSLHDRHGRAWQCGTIQLDLVMPRRFELSYADRSGERRVPLMLHRALYGSLERFMGMVLEQHGARLPEWLAPVQLAILPVAEAQHDAAIALAARLRARELRVEVEAEASLSGRIAAAHARGVPLTAVIGPREVSSGTVTLRLPGGQQTLPLDEAAAVVVERCRWALPAP